MIFAFLRLIKDEDSALNIVNLLKKNCPNIVGIILTNKLLVLLLPKYIEGIEVSHSLWLGYKKRPETD